MLGLSWFAMNKRSVLHGLVFFFLTLLGALVLFHLLLPAAGSRLTKQELRTSEVQTLHYLALGDSLTEGVGDKTGQGGFVPLLAQALTNDYGYQVEAENFGVSGNTSSQILKRLKEDKELAAAVKEADLMTLTVGGNDLRKLILKQLDSLDVATVQKASKDYGKRLKSLIEQVRKSNPDLPIYIVGIYNPLYLSLPELTEVQTMVDGWNQVTQEVCRDYDQVYFVPINDLLYKGMEGEAGVSQTAKSGSNSVLYEEDGFHPNNTGYEIMKKAIMEKMNETKGSWTF